MKQFESFRLDTSNECLWRGGAQIALPPKPFAILRYLVENPGRLITHDELLDALWPETYVQPQVLRTYVLDLRKILGDDAGSPRFIQTLPKRGYCFLAPVSESAAIQNRAAHNATPDVFPATLTIVDRDEELRRLHAQMRLAAGGQRQVVFVTGGAGIGKTALVDAFLGQVASTLSVTISRGQCVEALGRKEQYYPVMEALGQLCTSPDGERACRILARMAPLWLSALGRELPPESGARNAAERLPGELCAALEELASAKPLLLVFEDLHWADDSTLGLFSALTRRRTPARLMVLATSRDQARVEPRIDAGALAQVESRVEAQVESRVDSGPADLSLKALKQDLLVRRLGIELALEPLDRGAVRELLIRELGQQSSQASNQESNQASTQDSLPSGLADFVYQHSEGNPLFVIAMLEHLIAERYLVREGPESSAWRQRAPFPEIESGVPDELSRMIELEIERLSPGDQRLLEAASLVNVAFPAWAVAAALENDTAETEEACDDLARRLYFVRRAGQDELPDGSRSAFYVFSHGLYREVLYQRQAPSRRARRHCLIAERLGVLFAGREAHVAQEMATHFEAAGNWPRAVNSLRAAAQYAQQRNAHSEAAALLEHALQVADNLSDMDRAAVAAEIRAELTLRPAV